MFWARSAAPSGTGAGNLVCLLNAILGSLRRLLNTRAIRVPLGATGFCKAISASDQVACQQGQEIA